MVHSDQELQLLTILSLSFFAHSSHSTTSPTPPHPPQSTPNVLEKPELQKIRIQEHKGTRVLNIFTYCNTKDTCRGLQRSAFSGQVGLLYSDA